MLITAVGRTSENKVTVVPEVMDFGCVQVAPPARGTERDERRAQVPGVRVPPGRHHPEGKSSRDPVWPQRESAGNLRLGVGVVVSDGRVCAPRLSGSQGAGSLDLELGVDGQPALMFCSDEPRFRSAGLGSWGLPWEKQ